MQCPATQGVCSCAAAAAAAVVAAAAAVACVRYDLDHRALGFNKVKELVK
jgi:hypothetical protein